MQVDIGVALVIARSLMLLVIAITLCSYRDPSARHRPVVSAIATASAGTALAWAFYATLMLQHQAPPKPLSEIWPTLFVLFALIPVICARGNVAKLLPRAKWIY